MDGIKKIFKLIKGLWDNKRTRALAILICYIIFFTIVIVLFKSGQKKELTNNNTIEQTALYNYKSLKSYEATLNINDKLFLSEIKNDTTHVFKVVNDIDNVYKKDDNIYPDGIYFLDLSKFDNEFIYKYINSSKLDYESNYTGKKSYVISVRDFSILYNGNMISDDSYITIDTYEVNNNVKKIEINLSNYVKNLKTDINNYVIDIEYKN